MSLHLSLAPRALSARAPAVLAWAFALIAAALFLGLAIALFTTRESAVRNELVESVQRENRAAVAMLRGFLLDQPLAQEALRRREGPDGRQLPTAVLDLIDVAIRKVSETSTVIKVKLFDRSGEVVFSTDRSDIGTTATNPDFIATALRGIASGNLSHLARFAALDGVRHGIDVVETYLPLVTTGPRVDRVLELYSDVTPVLGAVEHRLRREMWQVGGALLAAYLFLMLIVAWGSRVLRESQSLVADRSERLNETSRLLDAGIESMSEGIAFWDSEHRLRKFNARYLEILPHLKARVRLGMTLKEINEVAFRALDPDASDEGIAKLVETRLAARRRPGEVWSLSLPTGRVVEVVDHDTDQGGFVTIFRDVTAATRAAESLAASEARLRVAIESIGDGFVMFDSADRVVLWNARYLEILPFLEGTLHVGASARDLLEALARSDAYGIPIEERAAWIEANVERRAPGRRVYRRELTDGRLLEGSVHEAGEGGFALILRDITAQRDTQLALAKSEQRFRDFASATADWFWEMDGDLRFTFLSESNYAITGMRAEDFYATSPLDFRPEGVSDQDWEVHLRQLREHEPFKDFRFRAIGPDGVERTVATSGRPFFDDEGRFKGYRGIGTDVSPIVKAQRQAEASEALLRDGIEGMASGFVMFDDQQRVALWNSRYIELFPYVREAMRVGLSARQLLTLHAASPIYGLPPEERAVWVESRMTHDPTRRGDLVQTLADGRTLRIHGTFSRSGGEIYVILDVTAEMVGKRRLEQTLRELRTSQDEVRRLALVAQHTDNAVIITDAAGRIEWVNNAFARISGYTAEEAIGHRPGALLQGPDTDPDTVAAIRTALVRQEGFRVEILNYAKGGRPYWVEIECAPVRGELGHAERFIAVEADITERKRQERRLAEALERERDVTLQQRRFVSVAAHEFRTPLTIIDGAAQRLMRYAEQVSPADLRERARRIRSAVQRMSQLVDTTLNTARLDEGRIELNLTSVDLVALIATICRRGDGFASDFKFAITATAQTLPIQADARLLDQIFTNLLSNAVKYSADSRRIDVSLRGDSQHVEVAIRDYGIGVPAEEVHHLFTRFYRASTAKGLPGTGIGLSLVRDLARLHGGDVLVQSAVKQGSTFTVRLPVSVDNARVATLAPAAA